MPYSPILSTIQGSNEMKKRLALLAGSLALSLGMLAMIVHARTSSTTTAPPGAKEAGHEAPRIASSRITHVTVYPDSALITREVEVPAGTGLIELVISPLPQATMPSSLYTESSDGIRVLTTRFRTQPRQKDTREEVGKVEEEIRKLQAEQRKVQAEVKALEANTRLLDKLENFTTASTTHATEKGKLDSDSTIALAKYLMEGRTERSKQMVVLQEQMLDIAEKMDFASRKMRDLTTGTSKIERDAVVVVDKVNNGAGKVKLNYLVHSAAWRPQYKFRAGKTTKDSVTVEYLGALIQQTGEDWERVQLTLSTAQPMLNAAPPDLNALAVAVVPRGAAPQGVTVSGLQQGLGLPPQPSAPGTGAGAGAGGLGGFGGMRGGPGGGGFGMPAAKVPSGGRLALANPAGKAAPEELAQAAKELRRQAQLSANLNRERDANELSNYAATLDQARELTMVEKKVRGESRSRPARNEGPSVTYHLASRFSVPSRNDDQVIEMARIDLKPDYFYKAVPVLTPHVYRQANLVNRSKYVLLPGEATMYHGSDFVGRMALPLVAIGEEFTVGFGAEPQLQVQRQLLDRTRTMQAGNQVLRYDYRILISSYKDEKVRLQVWDRLPRGENESLNITLIKASPELCKDAVYEREERASNLLRWDVEIDPDMRGEKALKIGYEFKLELDKQATLGSFW
jgi:hypothetical protein